MDIPEIRRVAIDSAEKYYQYLERNDKGLQEVEVFDIVAQHESELVYKLRLSAKLFDIDAVFFKLYHTNRLYNTGEIKVVEYDADKNVLIVKPAEEMIETFKRLPARDIKVISDLKFLVERIKKWYEAKGGAIGFPKNSSVLQGSFKEINYLPELELDGYVGRFIETKLEVDHVFLDEAGYANIIKALTLFNLNVPVTFLGDHMQLPPVCEINDSEIRQNPEYCNVFLWAQSAIFLEQVFSRSKDVLLTDYLENTPMVVDRMQQANLIHTYRFGKKLAAILDAHVYTNGFTSSLENGDTKVYYVHAVKTEAYKSRISANEVQAIRNIVNQFSPDEDFVILTPYKKQVQSLGLMMPKERNELKILTLHGSQGREWDTVILSVVDTGDKWFVDSKLPLSNGLNLLNTAVSRTKKRLIIVCDFRYWKDQRGQLVTDLLAEAEEMRIVN